MSTSPAKGRLASEASPYLLQHAADPVDWWPWGAPALAEAARRGVPLFISIGYSACHWCHVMQRESFRDEATAAMLNERFVCVKVDRELRPDVDALYMDYVVATVGSGGWPLTVFADADGIPLLGGTYFPRERRGTVPSLVEVALEVSEAYSTGGAELAAAVEGTRRFLHELAAPRATGAIDRDRMDDAAEYLIRLTDADHGGFGAAPKFPQAAGVLFLCAYHALNPDPDVAWSVEATLTGMLRGGIVDQVGGGIHRYAVDAAWRTPHFEKMLYDQALLLSMLAAAAPLTDSAEVRDEYADAARSTAAFLEREMSAGDGCHIASLAADTIGIEGATYTWTREQLRGALAPSDMALAERVLIDGATSEPFTLARAGVRADERGQVARLLATLKAQRDRRPQPDRDGKVVTSWNALAARGLMEAASAFADEDMSSRGVRALVRLLERAVRPDGLLHVADDPSVAEVRLIEDAAHVAAACLTAHDVTGEPTWLARATRLHDELVATFSHAGGLLMTPAVTDLPARPREQSDQPVPSGAATAVENAVRLARATGDRARLEWAATALRQFWGICDVAPEHAGTALRAAVMLEEADRR